MSARQTLGGRLIRNHDLFSGSFPRTGFGTRIAIFLRKLLELLPIMQPSDQTSLVRLAARFCGQPEQQEHQESK
jgi:hypothetical protein